MIPICWPLVFMGDVMNTDYVIAQYLEAVSIAIGYGNALAAYVYARLAARGIVV